MNRRSGIKIVVGLIGLVVPMLPIMLMAIIMGVIGFLASIAITSYAGYIVVSIIDNPSISITWMCTILVLCGLFRGVLRYVEQASNHYIAFKLLASIRDRVFLKLRSLTPAKLDGKEKGDLISMITSDVELLEVFYAHTISPVMIALIVSIIMVILFAQLHIVFACIAFTGYIVVGIVLPMYTSKRGKKIGFEQRQAFASLNTFVLESIHGLREILQFARGKDRLSQLHKKSEALDSKQKDLKNEEGISRALSDTSIMVFTIIMFFASLYLYRDGQVTITSIILSTILMASSFAPVTALSNLANNLLITFASGERILSLLEEQPQVEEVEDGVKDTYTSLSSEHVSFAYDTQEVLSDVNVHFDKQEIIGIKGKSGAGKTTLLKLFMRFYDPTSGVIRMSDTDLRQWNTKALRSQEAYVTQETYLFNDTILNNVKIANLDATQAEVEEACKKANIHDFIVSLDKGYDTHTGELGSGLSGGQKQRIGLARAFLSDAPCILLDEPTSNLDSLNEAAIMKTIKENAKDKMIIIVSHRDSSLRIADRLIQVETERKS